MAETKIKIVSNPYTEQVEFFALAGDSWTPINPSSRLLNEKLTGGFFPFKAEDIVNIILKEFGSGDKINIIFEGPADEWSELEAICTNDAYSDKVEAERAERHLSIARDILPEIIEVFKEIKPLVDSSVSDHAKVSNQIDKFTDVSSDIIPLCVLGNYSAGKSTFINALIGMEVLPNGDEPVTARVFQIKRSKDRDRAMIQFNCGENRYVLRFDPNGLMENKELVGIPLYDKVVAKVAKAAPGMAAHMNSALKVLNSYQAVDGDKPISDLIRLEVPFAESDPWPHDREFVIFDTPGSNSASNEDHVRVLRAAMDGLSNGLPIFVAEYSSLDSTDNEKLYKEIEQIPAIDERFAMIVVNKADSADLPKGGFDEDEVKQVMSWSIPRNLYGQGIYFVSSILGLGAKIDGEFMSDNYAEKFEDQQRKYIDPTSRFYKTLYRYDILPGQISRRTNEESEACKDLLLANSGLFCVENEIRLFAERYSAYNKCSRSEALLQEIVGITEDEIAAAKQAVEDEKKMREQELDDEKSALIDRLEAYDAKARDKACGEYPATVDAKLDATQWDITINELENRQRSITHEKRSDLGYSERTSSAADARDTILPNLVNRVVDSVQGGDGSIVDHVTYFASGIAEAAQGLVNDTQDAISKQGKVLEAEKAADKNAANAQIAEVENNYHDAATEIARAVDDISRDYWNGCAERCRDALYRIATADGTPLTDEKRKELGELIVNYEALNLTKARARIFNKADFTEFRVNDRVIFKSDKLFLDKVEAKYNAEIKTCIKETRFAMKQAHELAFKEWLNRLMGRIIGNIVDYNPVLRGYSEEINRKTAEIDSLEAKLATLEDRRDYVARVIGWKE